MYSITQSPAGCKLKSIAVCCEDGVSSVWKMVFGIYCRNSLDVKI